jgi:hypothetical protein
VGKETETTEGNQMKFVKYDTQDGKPVIETESRFLWWRWRVRYLADRQSTANYWHWLRLPGLVLVPDVVSFQLDAWQRLKPRDRK